VIFVTVGSIRFDALIRHIDLLVGAGKVSGGIIAQIGNGSYEPKNMQYFRTAPGLQEYYSRADLVIGHGGTGTTLEVLEQGLRLISVSNPSMIDNHQDEFLAALADRGLVKYCRSLPDLDRLIAEAMRESAPPPVDTRMFFETLIHDLQNRAGSGR
jgi:beta-1,4-N-acetylglucosaminyltransferase